MSLNRKSVLRGMWTIEQQYCFHTARRGLLTDYVQITLIKKEEIFTCMNQENKAQNFCFLHIYLFDKNI